ncbi:MAG: endolytic transglycosylase MltG [Agathobacter sp.]|nr:endolytic transglycosylase MltG [Agathobacter sp.]
MKFKYYLRGCGLGILVASIVLMVSFHSQNKTMDDTAVMERASELGMIMPETEIVSTEADSQLPESGTQSTDTDFSSNKNQKQNTKDSQNNTDGSSQKDEKDTQMASDDKTGSGNNKDTESKKKEDKKEESEEITVEIKKGEVCRQLAEDLEQIGLVEDAETFRKYMQQLGYDDRIKVGTYTLKRGMTEKEIADTFVEEN